MVTGTLMILATWIALYLIFSGIGLAVGRALGLKQGQWDTAMSFPFWLGWVSILAFLQIWHLFAPVSSAALGVVGLGGVGGALWCKTAASRHLMELAGRGWRLSFALLAFSLLLANEAMGPIEPYDAGLYHIQTIRWISSYPVVPGLGNLHMRLAFNSSHFLYLALLNTWPWTGYCHHVGNGLLVWVLCLQLGACIRGFILNRGGRADICDTFHVLMVPGVLWQCTLHASSTSPDLPLFILGVLTGGCLCRLLFHAADRNQIYATLFIISALWFAGVTIRLSFLVLGAACLVAGVFFPRKQRDGMNGLRPSRPMRDLLRLSAPAILVIVWLIRGAILSGYPAYPVTAVSFDVPWKVPDGIAVGEVQWIKSWARNPELPPDLVLVNADWLGSWFLRMLSYHKIEMVLPLLLAILGLCIFFHGIRKGAGHSWRGVLFLSPAVVSLVAWFLQAPSPRFAGACFWYLGAGALAVGLHPVTPKTTQKALIAGISAVMSAAVIAAFLDRADLPRRSFHTVPMASYDTFITRSGLCVYAPAKGDQCWDAPLPCTPYPKKDLSLLSNGNLGNGFSLSPQAGSTKGRNPKNGLRRD